VSTAAALPDEPQELQDTPRTPAVLTPVPEVATRVGTRADALTPARSLQFLRTAVSSIGTPPDIWSDDRPSLQKLWLYTWHGTWTRDDETGERSPARVLAGLYAVLLAIPLTAPLYYLLWIIERPARLAVALTLVGLFILIRH
jgi:hypothetical protein